MPLTFSHVRGIQGVSYYDQEITVDLFDQADWKSSGVDASLVYQPLVDGRLLLYTSVDAADRCDDYSLFCCY